MDEPTTEEIRAALEAATPGPWFVEAHGLMDACRSRTIVLFGESDEDNATAHLIANAPTWLAYLLARMKDAESGRDGWQQSAEQMLDWLRSAGRERDEALAERDAAVEASDQRGSQAMKLADWTNIYIDRALDAERERDALRAALKELLDDGFCTILGDTCSHPDCAEGRACPDRLHRARALLVQESPLPGEETR